LPRAFAVLHDELAEATPYEITSLALAGAVRKRGEDNERVVAMAPPSSALRPHSSPVV